MGNIARSPSPSSTGSAAMLVSYLRVFRLELDGEREELCRVEATRLLSVFAVHETSALYHGIDMGMRSRSWTVTTRKIASHEKLQSLLLRLMIFNNDVAILTDTIDEWAATENPKRVHRKGPATLYFARVLLGHVFEALEIIREIDGSPELLESVECCGGFVLEAFLEVNAYRKLEANKTRLAKMRNCAAFHYDPILPLRALKQIEKVAPERSWSYSMGDTALDYRFELGEEVMAGMVVREVYGLAEPRSAERSAKLEKIAAEEQRIARLFTGFAAHFVRHYSK